MRRKKWISIILAVSVICVNSSVGVAAGQKVNQDGWKIWDDNVVKTSITPMDEKANQWKEIFTERTKTKEGATSSDELSESEENANYQLGFVRAMFMDSSGNVERIKVLTDKESGKIWIDGEDFVGNLNYYSYSCNKSEKTIEITVRNKMFGFQTGSSQMAYKIGDNEAFYSMSEPVKKYNHRLWIPADDFFYLIGCKISPLITTNSGDYIPEKDILVIRDPQYTVLDVLYDIFSEKNGMGWMFSYEKDFGVDEKTLTDLMTAGRMGTSLYGTATLELETILSYLTGPLVEAVNNVAAKSSVTDADFDEIPDFYDKTFVRGFVEKMLSVTEGELEFMAEEEEAEIDGFLSIAEIAAENFGEIVSETEGREMEKVLDTWSQNTDLWKVFKSDYDEISKSFKTLESGSESLKSMLSLFGVVLTEAGIVQGMMNHDDLLAQAMELYLKDSKTDNRTPAKIRKLLESQFAKQKTKAGYFVTESVRQNLMSYITGILKSSAANLTGKEFMGILGISAGSAKFVWSLLESSGLDPLPKVSEAEAVQMAVYGMMYEPDAWRELAVGYLDIAAGNGLNDYEEIKDAAYMAANYLKACYVTCEAGIKSLESAEFADSDSYAAAKTKLRKISMMLGALAADIQLAEGEEQNIAGGYGVILENSRFYDNELTYDLFVNPSTQPDGKNYSYYLGNLDAPSYKAKIEPVVIKLDYYQFIHDEILPERGLASLDKVKKNLTSDDAWQNIGWSQKEGVLGADIADLNQDGIDELLLYILEKKTDDTDGTVLKAELYALNDNGEIERSSWMNLATFSEIEYERVKIGLMEKDGRIYLYRETDRGGYFADGGKISYIWNFMSEDNDLKTRWSIGQSGFGGENSTASSNSLADFYGPTEGDIQVLSTDGEFHASPKWVGRPCDIYVLTAYGEYRASRPEEEVLDDSYSDSTSAIRKGFGILGIDSMAEYDYSDNKYDFENGYGLTLWNTGYMKESCSYESRGDKQEDSSRRNMRITVSDCTGLREKLDGLAG